MDCENLCNDLSTDDTVKKSLWEKRLSKNETNWENCREELFSAVLVSLIVPDEEVICMLCQKEPALIRCRECKLQYLCHECDDEVHTDTTHCMTENIGARDFSKTCHQHKVFHMKENSFIKVYII